MALSILIIGLGYFGESLARELSKMGHEVLGVDTDMDVVQRNAPFLSHAVQMDAANLDALRTLDIPSFDICVVGRGAGLEDSVLITLNCKELSARYLICKAVTDQQTKILQRIGADQIVEPERNMGRRVAHMIGSTAQTLDYMDVPGDYSIREVAAPEDWWERSLRDLALPRRHGLQVLLIKSGDTFDTLPDGDTVVHQGDLLIVFGQDMKLSPFDMK